MSFHVYHKEFLNDYTWGDDIVMLNNDTNLLKKSECDIKGYDIITINDYNSMLCEFVQSEIEKVTSRSINIEKYHYEVTEEEHAKILHSMPYKKTQNKNIYDLCIYLEKKISETLKEEVKVFNDDIWLRICRPSHLNTSDYNPCHKDIYLDFLRNNVNIYLPIVGSNDKSSLLIQPESHKWNENITIVTKGGAYFKKTNKKYSVDTIVASKLPLNMIRPNPKINQILLFSPYLIHGCSSNDNIDMTRISLEVRFIKNNFNSMLQEEKARQHANNRAIRVLNQPDLIKM